MFARCLHFAACESPIRQFHRKDQVLVSVWYQGIRVSYLDWGAFSHGLFLQAPSKQRKEKGTKQRENKWGKKKK